MNTATIDARHLLCPLPVIRTQDAVADCRPGDQLQVVCTDPGVVHDIPAWCRVHGHEVYAIERSDNEIMIGIQVGEAD
ncbi:MAG: sulfurtransferase TusA family protein [Gammaproteobacteria bacterium]|nr:sulfurtransferase TusA family protein [Gammaproteobacteria bacterium]